MSNAVEIALRVLHELAAIDGSAPPPGGDIAPPVGITSESVLLALSANGFDLNEAMKSLSNGD